MRLGVLWSHLRMERNACQCPKNKVMGSPSARPSRLQTEMGMPSWNWALERQRRSRLAEGAVWVSLKLLTVRLGLIGKKVRPGGVQSTGLIETEGLKPSVKLKNQFTLPKGV